MTASHGSNVDSQPSDDHFSDGAGAELPDLGYWIGLYAVEGIDFDEILSELDPSNGRDQHNMIRPEGRLTSKEACIHEAIRLHPMRCAMNTSLCRDLFLIADSEQYSELGLLFVQITWDKAIDNDSMESLAAKGAAARIVTKRIPARRHETATLFNMVVKGYVPFKSSHPTFIFYDECRDYNSKSIRWLDRQASKRASGTEHFLEGSMVDEVLITETRDKHLSRWEQVIRRHPLQVYKERFCDNLQQQYFVFSETEIKSAKDEVVLARTGWQGTWETLTDRERDGQDVPAGALDVSTIHCAAGEAYNFLVDIVTGKKAWPSG
ncbi:hypothetical protein AMS68_002594 [Peltaster fructicola]|uniref:Uncharacterized protein n=1 Tax=Peltaster fructicola TaxID=286661 RepID=A0A6H0XQP2_9PEZI|nr:hypothetical protein AMS68_002594 [Peltaster fructicola]